VVALWAIVLLAAYLQRQAGLSTVGEAHLLAVDWLDWFCYKFYLFMICRKNSLPKQKLQL
jgi:hypothetical protein